MDKRRCKFRATGPQGPFPLPLPPTDLLLYLRVAVVTLGEVSVVGGDDRVLLPLLLRAVPLSDARAASVGQDGRTGVLEGRREPIAGNRRADLTRKQKRSMPRLSQRPIY